MPACSRAAAERSSQQQVADIGAGDQQHERDRGQQQQQRPLGIADERIAQGFSWCLAHRGDLVAYLASHEESLRALDDVQGDAAAGTEERGRVEDLALANGQLGGRA